MERRLMKYKTIWIEHIVVYCNTVVRDEQLLYLGINKLHYVISKLYIDTGMVDTSTNEWFAEIYYYCTQRQTS